MGGCQDRGTGGSLFAHCAHNRGCFRWVDRGECLIKKQYPARLVLRQGARHCYALLLTTRKRVVRSISQSRQSNALQCSFHALRIRRPSDATERSNFTNTEWRANIRPLRHQCNPSGALQRTECMDRFAINEYRSRIRRQ
jgi:hypothetical protein